MDRRLIVLARGCGLIAMLAALAGCAVATPMLTEQEVEHFARGLSASVYETAGEPSAAVTMEEAVTRAIRFNHAIRAQELQAALAAARVFADGAAMLPELVAESRYFQRNRPNASRASDSTVYTTSSETASLTTDVTLSWSLLDFGLSYIRARQGLDQAHSELEEARRIAGRIAEETRATYWRTAALQRLLPALARLEPELEAALRLSEQAAGDPRGDPLAPITFQREVLNLKRDLNQLGSSLAGADAQLMQLAGLQGTSGPRLAQTTPPPLTSRLPATSLEDDLAAALRQRPEIRQHMYDLRITDREIDATLLQLLPGVTLRGSHLTDANSFLLHSSWMGWGVTAAGNLLRLARLEADLDVVEHRLAWQRRLAVATAATVIMQVHLARARIHTQLAAYREAQQFAAVQRKLLDQVGAAVAAGRAGRQALTRERLATLLAEVRAVLAFADLQAALASHSAARGDWPVEQTADAQLAGVGQWTQVEQQVARQ